MSHNAMVLRLQVDRLESTADSRQKNAGTENIQLENDYKLMMQMYLSLPEKNRSLCGKNHGRSVCPECEICPV